MTTRTRNWCEMSIHEKAVVVRRDGREARRRGVSIDDCPYIKGDNSFTDDDGRHWQSAGWLYAAWHEGWQEANEDIMEDASGQDD